MNNIKLLLVVIVSSLITNYFFLILGFILDRSWMQTDSKGIKNLKFQQWNPTWQKYVTPLIR